MKWIFIFLVSVSCSQLSQYKTCDDDLLGEELNALGKIKLDRGLQYEAKSCYEKSCYKKDFEGCYQFASIIGYDNKKQSEDVMNLICSQGYKKACPSKFSNKKVWPRDSEKYYSPNEKSALRSWTKLLGKTLERNVNRVGD